MRSKITSTSSLFFSLIFQKSLVQFARFLKNPATRLVKSVEARNTLFVQTYVIPLMCISNQHHLNTRANISPLHTERLRVEMLKRWQQQCEELSNLHNNGIEQKTIPIIIYVCDTHIGHVTRKGHCIYHHHTCLRFRWQFNEKLLIFPAEKSTIIA